MERCALSRVGDIAPYPDDADSIVVIAASWSGVISTMPVTGLSHISRCCLVERHL